MRKNIFRFAFVAAFISIIISCQKNSDTSPTGLDRDKFIGAWNVSGHGTQSSNQHWTMTIVAGSSNSEMLLDNFDQIGSTHSVTASVSGSSFTIPQQTVSGNIFKGSGNYNSNGSLSFNYTADDQSNPVDTVTATATK